MRIINPYSPINYQSKFARNLVGAWMVYTNYRTGYGTSIWRDLSSKFNNGTLIGATWSGLAPPGGFGSLSFDGTDDAVSITPVSLGDFSLITVFNGSDFNLTNRILWGCSTEVLTFIGFLGSNTTVYYRSSASTLLSFTVPAISLNAWHHIMVTRTGNSIRVFVDWIESSSGAQNDSSTPAYVVDIIGSYPTASLGWNGYLSNVSIHNVACDISYLRGYPTLLNYINTRKYFLPLSSLYINQVYQPVFKSFILPAKC